jgi:hypothetical protein
MDVILTEKMDQALLKVAVTLLARSSRRLMACEDLEDVLTFLKQEMTGESSALSCAQVESPVHTSLSTHCTTLPHPPPAWDEPSLHDILTEAFKQPWTPRQEAALASLEGAESVSEAQARIGRAQLAAVAAAAGGGDRGEEQPDDSGSGNAAAGSGGGGGAQSSRLPPRSGGGGSSGGGLSLLPPPSSAPVAFLKGGGSFRSRGAGAGSSGPPSPAPGATGSFTSRSSPTAATAAAAVARSPTQSAPSPSAPPTDMHALLGDWDPFAAGATGGAAAAAASGGGATSPSAAAAHTLLAHNNQPGHHSVHSAHPAGGNHLHSSHHAPSHPPAGLSITTASPAISGSPITSHTPPVTLDLLGSPVHAAAAASTSTAAFHHQHHHYHQQQQQAHAGSSEAAAAAAHDAWGDYMSSPHVNISGGGGGGHAPPRGDEDPFDHLVATPRCDSPSPAGAGKAAAVAAATAAGASKVAGVAASSAHPPVNPRPDPFDFGDWQ